MRDVRKLEAPIDRGVDSSMHGSLMVGCVLVGLALVACAAPAGRAGGRTVHSELRLETREAIANASRVVAKDAPALADAAKVSQTLDAFHGAAAAASFDAYFATMTDDAVFLGTDASERWDLERFMAYCRPYFERGQGWTYLARERFVRVSGDMAWVDEVLENEKYGKCRGTALLVRSPEGIEPAWRVSRYALAFLIPNEVAAEATGLGKGKR